LTVAGVLIGGAGAVIRLGAGSHGSDDLAQSYDPADFLAPDRDAQANRVSRDEERAGAPTTATPMPTKTTAKASGNASVKSSGTCEASYYDEPQETASGERFDPTALTAAHKSLPFNSTVRVTNTATGKSVVVRINDRGPFVSGRCLDLSEAAFAAIANLGAGVVDVRYDVLVQDAT
jgi:rare lipoprotein A